MYFLSEALGLAEFRYSESPEHTLHHTELKDKCRGLLLGWCWNFLWARGSWVTGYCLRGTKKERCRWEGSQNASHGTDRLLLLLVMFGWRCIHCLWCLFLQQLARQLLMQSNVLLCSDDCTSCADPLKCLHLCVDSIRARDQSPFYPVNLFLLILCR